MNSNFKGERLKNARLYRALTLTDLAKQTNLTKQALSQYENGTSNPQPENIIALAEALKFPFEYFVTNATYEVKPSEAAYFRSLMTTNKKDRTAQTVRLEFIAQIYETLIDYVDFPDVNLPKVSFSDHKEDFENEAEETAEIESIAQEVRKQWGLGDKPIPDLRYVLEENGIVVTCVSINADKIDAFSQRMTINGNGVYFVVISKDNTSFVRARFDMVHELGHILIHPWSEDLEHISREEFKLRERQANLFASAFLLPKETFGKEVSLYPNDLKYYEHLKKKWNVSIMAMVYRTHQLGIISTNQYQYLMKQISKAGWRSQGEPLDRPYIPQSTLLQGAVELLFSEDVLTASQFLNVLKSKGIYLNPNEIEDLLCLKAGTLRISEEPKIRLIQLKARKDDEDTD
jgi:Zn-dependent peptidase ImmA (M78 family)/DNA-binding XRE family transcriptional regulator